MTKKSDFNKAMDKAMDGATKLATSIAKNDVCMTPQIGVSIQILIQELLFAGYTKTKVKEIFNKSLSLAEKENNWLIKEIRKKELEKRSMYNGK